MPLTTHRTWEDKNGTKLKVGDTVRSPMGNEAKIVDTELWMRRIACVIVEHKGQRVSICSRLVVKVE